MVSIVQYKEFNDFSGDAASVATFDAPITSGSIILISFGFQNTGSFSSISDGGDPVTDSGIGEIDGGYTKAYIKGFLSASAGRTAVTINLTGTYGWCIGRIYEVAGLTSAVFDGFSGNNNGGAATTSWSSLTTATLSSASEIAIGMSPQENSASAIDEPYLSAGYALIDGASGWAYGALITSSTAALAFSGTSNQGIYGALLATVKSGGAATYQINGVTRDNTGNLIGSCDVFLLKYNSGTHLFTQIAHTTSNASTGTYTFTGIADNAASYCVVAWKDGTPHVYDVSDRNIKPV